MRDDKEFMDTRLLTLISDLQDGSISDSDRKLLTEMLKDDFKARAVYHKMVDLHVRLDTYYTEGGVLAGMPDHKSFVSPKSHVNHSGSNKRNAWWMAIAAVLVFGLIANLLFFVFSGGSPVHEEEVLSEIAGVAVLTKAVAVDWGDTVRSDYREGQALPAGLFEFDKGFVQIEFFGGATVILEAPARFELLSSERARISYGKLRAFVPEAAQGFIIEGPNFDTVDLGTEFALRVDSDGNGEVHVLEGEVSLHSKDGSLIQNLSGGLGVRADTDSHFEAIPSGHTTFVGREKLAQIAQENNQLAALNYEHERHHWANDPDTVVYFDFEASQPWERHLRSCRQGTPEGAVVGAQWTQGRWPGKGALEFKNVNDRVRLQVPGEFEEVTFSIRVRIDGFPHWINGLFLTDGFDLQEPHWQITREGVVSFGIRGVGSLSAPRILWPKDMGRWLHLVAVYDSKQKRISHYLDGELIASEVMKRGIPIRIGGAEIGNWKASKRSSNSIRSLTGTVDSFLFLKRALSAAEVKELYQNGYLSSGAPK